jgi:hypothetical protein
MSHVNMSSPSATRRSSRTGTTLVMVMGVVVILFLVALYLFSGPLGALNRTTPSVSTPPNVVMDVPPRGQRVPPPEARPVPAQASQALCQPDQCHLTPIEIDNSAAMGTGYINPVEMDVQFTTPIATAEELGRLMQALISGGGIGLVRSDGEHMIVQYDTAAVQPNTIRQRIAALGYPVADATTVKDAGDAAD